MVSEQKIIIYNKFYKLDKNTSKAYFHNNGEALNSDRVITITDAILMSHINAKSRFFTFLTNFLFYNNDFRKQKSLSENKVNRFRMLNNILLWGSIIGLIICLIFGIAIPIFNAAADSLQLVQGNFTGSVIANNKIIGWVIVQDNMINVSNSLMSKLNSLTSTSDYDAFFNANSDLSWFKYYIEQYFGPRYNVFGIDALISFRDFLSTHVFSEFKFVNFTEEFQALAYFKMVIQTIEIGEIGGNINSIINSWNGLMFTKLPSSNIFYGLDMNSICLTENKSSQALLVPKIWEVWFKDPSVIVPLVFTLIFIFIVVANYYILRKNKVKYYNMNMYEYLAKKAGFIKKYHFFLNKIVFLNNKINELKHNIILNFDSLGSADVYNILRLLNYLYSTVESMNIVLVCKYSDEWKTQLDKLSKEDTRNLRIDIVNNNLVNEWTDNLKNNNQSFDLKAVEAQQYYNYVQNYLRQWNNINERDLLAKLSHSFTRQFKRSKLTKEQETLIINEILKNKEFQDLNNQTFNLLKIFAKTRNWQLFKLMEKIINKNDE
ncbi:MAG: hypothetical protein K2I36_01800 [Ureaplasma sp.]|nr:hypothetical protein [Ureaplasma sp.]